MTLLRIQLEGQKQNHNNNNKMYCRWVLLDKIKPPDILMSDPVKIIGSQCVAWEKYCMKPVLLPTLQIGYVF